MEEGVEEMKKEEALYFASCKPSFFDDTYILHNLPYLKKEVLLLDRRAKGDQKNYQER